MLDRATPSEHLKREGTPDGENKSFAQFPMFFTCFELESCFRLVSLTLNYGFGEKMLVCSRSLGNPHNKETCEIVKGLLTYLRF